MWCRHNLTLLFRNYFSFRGSFLEVRILASLGQALLSARRPYLEAHAHLRSVTVCSARDVCSATHSAYHTATTTLTSSRTKAALPSSEYTPLGLNYASSFWMVVPRISVQLPSNSRAG